MKNDFVDITVVSEKGLSMIVRYGNLVLQAPGLDLFDCKDGILESAKAKVKKGCLPSYIYDLLPGFLDDVLAKYGYGYEPVS